MMAKYVLNKTGMAGMLLLLMAYLTVGCKSAASDEASTMVAKWMGRKINFPPGIPCSRLGDSIACEPANTRYRVLLYTDSMGCVSCNLRIDEWKKIITESQKKSPGLISYHFYFNPRAGDNLTDLFKKENFKEQVYLDKTDLLNKANEFPGQMIYQCFLLNDRNEVVLVGNPTLNENIHKLYMDLIDGKFEPGKKDD